MPRGAKKLPPAEQVGPTFVGKTLPEDAAQEQQMAAVIESYSSDRDLINQLLGQVRMAQAIGKFADVVSLTQLRQIKESKAYRALKGVSGTSPTGEKIADVGTFEGFCAALGRSVSQVDEDLRNLNVFGDDALKTLSAAGAGYRELRQFRKLPEDEKTALIEVAKSGDKDDVRELAEELLAKQVAASALTAAKLTKERDNAVADAEAARQRTSERDETIRKVEAERDRARRSWGESTPDEQMQILRESAQRQTQIVINLLAPNSADVGLKGCLVALSAHAYDHDQDVSSFIGGLIGDILMAARRIRDGEGVRAAVVKDEPAAYWMGLADRSTEG